MRWAIERPLLPSAPVNGGGPTPRARGPVQPTRTIRAGNFAEGLRKSRPDLKPAFCGKRGGAQPSQGTRRWWAALLRSTTSEVDLRQDAM